MKLNLLLLYYKDNCREPSCQQIQKKIPWITIKTKTTANQLCPFNKELEYNGSQQSLIHTPQQMEQPLLI